MAAPLLYDTGSELPGIDPEDAVQILPTGVDREHWLAVRTTGIGGSDASTLVGLNSYRSRYELWLEKTGQAPAKDLDDHEPVRWGNLLEPVVRDEFARRAAVSVRQVGTLRSSRWPWMLANPDGLTDDGGGYEGKTTSAWLAHEWAEDQTPDHAELQAQWCMAVTGLSHWYVAGLIGGQRLETRRVERDPALISQLVEISGRFWREHIETSIAPAVDGSSAMTDLLSRRFPQASANSVAEVDEATAEELVTEKERAAAAEKDAAEQHEAVKNRIKNLIGDRERLVTGDREIATWRNTGRFSEKQFTRDHPELASEYECSTTTLDTKRLAADHPETYAAYRARTLRFTQ